MNGFLPFYKALWSDKKFKALPNSDHRIIYLFLFFFPRMNLTGIFEVDLEECQFQTKINNNFDSIFQEVVNGKYNIKFDKETDIIWVMNRFAYIPTKSSKVIAGAIDELNLITHSFKNEFIKKYTEELSPFIWRLKGYKIRPEEVLTEDFVFNASKLYTNRTSLKTFMMNKGASEQRIDQIIARVLPGWLTQKE